MLLYCCINLVKLDKFWLSKILGMTYNLERREYQMNGIVSNCTSAPASNDRCFPGFTSEPAAPGLLAEKKNKLSTNNLANIFQKGTVNCLISNPLAIASIRLKGSWLLREL